MFLMLPEDKLVKHCKSGSVNAIEPVKEPETGEVTVRDVEK